MGVFSELVGGGVAEPIKAIGNVLDKLFTSDEERLDKKILMERLAQQPLAAQQDINRLEVQHRSLFVAGWRPFIGWTCGFGIFYQSLIYPICRGFGIEMPPIDTSSLHSMVIAMLGLGGYRTYEKIKGKTV